MIVSITELEDCYFIYHAPFLNKVGITKRLRKRLRDQKLSLGKDCEVVVTVSRKLGPKIAGDIEFLLADHYGYKKANHYDENR
jgi:hypothetical protein